VVIKDKNLSEANSPPPPPRYWT